MTMFHALVDAFPGREPEVVEGLRKLERVDALVPCKAGSYDVLIRFEAAAFDQVDEFLQTHVRRVPGVKGVEIIVDFADQPQVVKEARERLA